MNCLTFSADFETQSYTIQPGNLISENETKFIKFYIEHFSQFLEVNLKMRIIISGVLFLVLHFKIVWVNVNP